VRERYRRAHPAPPRANRRELTRRRCSRGRTSRRGPGAIFP
jgi:hypothetical protein